MSTEFVPDEEIFAYFGYGSLVNRATLPENFVNAIPATLNGWRRHWQHRPEKDNIPEKLRDIALLSVHEDKETSIEGLLIIDRISNLPALEAREKMYDKTLFSGSEFRFKNKCIKYLSNIPVYIFVARKPDPALDFGGLKLLRSYLDVVMQGYEREFGRVGVERFLQTTDNFPDCVLEDRELPIYPRHQNLTNDEKLRFLALLK